MKEIGEALKEQRESIGITIDEAASDLKLTKEQIENIEAGKKEAFDDIYYLKYFIRDYSKYLGLNYEDMIDEFNEFLFDYTSKISMEDIKKAQRKQEAKEDKSEKRIASPYTIERKKNFPMKKVLFLIFILLFIIGVVFFVKNKVEEKEVKKPTSNLIK